MEKEGGQVGRRSKGGGGEWKSKETRGKEEERGVRSERGRGQVGREKDHLSQASTAQQSIVQLPLCWAKMPDNVAVPLYLDKASLTQTPWVS